MKGQEVIGAAAHTSLQNRNWPQAQWTAELCSERYIKYHFDTTLK